MIPFGNGFESTLKGVIPPLRLVFIDSVIALMES